MITIEKLCEVCHDDTIRMTQHMALRCEERGIEYETIKKAIQNGEIIEQYPSDYPYPSCLIFHRSESNKCLHIVVGLGDGLLWLITAYYPDADEWENDYKTRKAGI